MNFFSKSTWRRTLSMSSGLTFLKKFLDLVVGEICGLWKSSMEADVGVGRADGGSWAERGPPPLLSELPVGEEAVPPGLLLPPLLLVDI